jgi:probable F420-dependent oxidoreductase
MTTPSAETTMKVGLHLPQWGAGASRAGVLEVARAAEDAGLDSLWVADHVVHPLGAGSRYPYGDPPFAPEDGFLEALTTLAVVAGATERVALGTSVLVPTMRQPLLVAKTIATLDVLSKGRTLVGVGAGWWREEFAALGAPFERRGARMDEQLELLRALWRDGAVAHRGRFYEIDELVCEPRPVRPGGPPILVGGMGPRARRRAATLGDGWHALGSHADTLAEGFADVRRIAREAGRDERALMLSTSIALPPEPERALRRLRRLERIGVRHVVVTVPGGAAGCLAAIELLAGSVLPEVHAA